MRKIGRIILWYWLLNKRLFKKISFIIILALVPLTVAAFSAAATEDSGILTIALSREDAADRTASEAVEALASGSEVIHFEVYDAPQEAVEAVESGKADAAWIFAENLQEKLDGFVAKGGGNEPAVKVYAIEESAFLRLAREKLFAVLYSGMSKALYRDFIVTEVSAGIPVDEDVLEYHYGIVAVDRDIIQFAFMDDGVDADSVQTEYLTAPVRGMLALMMVLVGLAASMYLIQDETAGTYTWLSKKAKLPFGWGWHLIAITDMAVVVLAALASGRLFVGWDRELPIMLLYCLSCAGFCDVVKRLCKRTENLGAAIPILMLLMIVLCPLFLNVRRLRVIQYLLPPFYYLHGINNSEFSVLLVIYTVGIFAVDAVIAKIQSR